MGYLPAGFGGTSRVAARGRFVKVMSFDTKAIVEKTEADKAKFSELFGG